MYRFLVMRRNAQDSPYPVGTLLAENSRQALRFALARFGEGVEVRAESSHLAGGEQVDRRLEKIRARDKRRRFPAEDHWWIEEEDD